MTLHPITTTTTTTMANTITTTSTHPHQPPRPQKNHQNIRIRTTTSPTAAAAIVALGAQTFTETFGHSVTPDELQAYLDEAYTLDAITADLADPHKTTIIATAPRSLSPAAPTSHSIVAAAASDCHSRSNDEKGTREDDDEEEEEGEQVLLGFALLTRNSNLHEPCVAHLDPESAVELQRLYVAAAAQGMGVGSLLMRAAEDVARAEGRRDVWLGVWEGNRSAQRAYERWGYGRVGEHGFVVGGVVQTDWILAKGL